MRPFLLILALIVLTGAFMTQSSSARAEEEQIQFMPQFKSHIQPFSQMLSGRSWLVASGQDPALSSFDRKEALSGVGSGSAQGGGGAALVPYRDPSAKFSRNVLISEDFGDLPFQTEPHLAVNPKDPDHIIAGMIDYGFPSLSSYVSIDGGATWEGPARVKYPRSDLASAGDPIIEFDRNGKAYYGYISVDVEEFVIGPLVGQSEISRISISRTDDGGLNWQDPIAAASASIRTRLTSAPDDPRVRGFISFGFLDKPWMAVGPDRKDPNRDVIYITYTNFISTWQVFWIDELPFLGAPILETVIEMVSSRDGGITWTQPVEVSPVVSYFTPAGQMLTPAAEVTDATRRIVQGSRPAVAPDGTVHVAWVDTTADGPFEGLAEIYVATSNDGGRGFNRPVRASFFLEPGFLTRNSFFRYWGTVFPRIDVGPAGEVYIVFTGVPSENPEDDGEVYFLKSTDKGATWSRRAVVNDDKSGRVQFFPEIAVSPNGDLHVMWGDMRDDRREASYHIYYTSSTNRGETWNVNSRVSDFASNPSRAFPRGLFIGDYFAMRATDEDVYMVWADARLGEFGPSNQKIAFARQRLMPSPSIFLSPPSGAGGKDVIIQGFNFQANRDYFVLVDGVVISNGRTQKDGVFSSRIFIPIASEGPHDVQILDSSGNAATASFFMDFGFSNLQELDASVQAIQDRIVGANGENPNPIAG
ncbi:MAG: hypothetical protein FJ320_04700, partial [SAR202 cluster bacterium]|nr:hypothetical protein [SAR202 cluster bacterium]